MSKRRAAGEGNVRLRSDGRWEGRLYVDGKRLPVYGRTQAEAVVKLEELKQARKHGLPLMNKAGTVVDYFGPVWPENVRHLMKPRSFERYSEVIEQHIVPVLGRVRLEKLTREHWNAVFSQPRSNVQG